MLSPDSTASISAACQCDAVRIKAALPSLWLAHCHCTQCRRAHGAGFVTWIGFAESACAVDDIRGSLRWYASSPPAQRGFCAHCGSMMMFRSARWPGELHIAVGVLEDPPDRQPQAHVYWSEHVTWSGVADNDALPHKD